MTSPIVPGASTASMPVCAAWCSTCWATKSNGATAKGRSSSRPTIVCSGRSASGRGMMPAVRSPCGNEWSMATREIQTSAASERAAMRAKNLLGQLHRHHDEAGLTTVAAVDFKGNVLDKSRRVIADAPILAVFDQAPANAWRVTPFQVDWEPRPQQTLADRESELLENDGLPDHVERRCPQSHQATAVAAGRGRKAAGIAPALQQRRRAGKSLSGRHALRRAHRLRRQGPARAHRLRQRRHDPLCLRPAHVSSEAPAQRALLPNRTISPTDPAARLCRTLATTTIWSATSSASATGRRTAAFQTRRSAAMRSTENSATTHSIASARPRGAKPISRPIRRGTTHRGARTSTARVPTPSSIATTRWATCCACEHRNDQGGFTREFHRRGGQQPTASHADWSDRLRLRLRR